MNFNTHCGLRLGDNLAHVHFARKMAAKYPEHVFTHAAHLAYLNQLLELTWDLPNLRLIPFEYRSADSIDVWKNAGGYWENHKLKYNYGRFYIEFFEMIAAKMGLESPLKRPPDLLFDYPAIKKPANICEPFDCLVVNSAPQSNQWLAYNEKEMESMVEVLARKNSVITTAKTSLRVPCTGDCKPPLSVTAIGTLSLYCKYIVMVATGPSWPTFNVWNTESIKRRIILNGTEDVNIAPNTVTVRTCGEALKMCEMEGII